MQSLRPAYPKGFYVFGAFATVALLMIGVLRPVSAYQAVSVASAYSASSPQMLALDLNQ